MFARPAARHGRQLGLAASIAAAAVLAAFPPAASAHWPSPTLADLDVIDRTSGTTLAVHDKDGQHYVVGAPGHEYTLRIRNRSRERIVAVTSVDGVNVVTGETASPHQSGYVIDAGGSVEIAGWRRSLDRTSAFYFTDLGDSYAARTGRPNDVGVIGVAVFRERRPAVAQQPLRDKIAAHESAAPERADAPASPPAARAESGGLAAQSGAGNSAADTASRAFASKLGTGFGRDETSYAQRVTFERASATPSETLAIRYDRLENLIALGVLAGARYAERAPDPFPGMRFVPAPR
jgi:hypothetical protein